MQILPLNFLGLKIDRAKKEQFVPIASQIRSGYESDFTFGLSFLGSSVQEMDFYDKLRNEIPLLDIAPIKINRLIGDFDIEADESTRKELLDFKKLVSVSRVQRGFPCYQYQMFDSVLSKGMAFSEIVPWKSMTGIAYLKTAKANSFSFFVEKDGSLSICQTQNNNMFPVKLQNQEYIQYLATDIRDGDPRGKSLFHSLPFVAQILYRMEKAIDNTVWRVGDPSFISKVKVDRRGQEGAANKVGSEVNTKIANIAKERRLGKVRDATIVLPEGVTLEIDILGNGKFIEHLEFPMNTIIDQIVGKTGLPHWMLGFRRTQGMNSNLSETEADMLTADIEWYRSQFDPIIEKIFDIQLILSGKAGKQWKHIWNPVSLRDDKAMAEARKYNAEAEEKEIANIMTLDTWGAYSSQEEVEDILRERNLIKYLPKEKETRRRWWEANIEKRLAKELMSEYVQN